MPFRKKPKEKRKPQFEADMPMDNPDVKVV
jgi:hypothetical protein